MSSPDPKAAPAIHMLTADLLSDGCSYSDVDERGDCSGYGFGDGHGYGDGYGDGFGVGQGYGD